MVKVCQGSRVWAHLIARALRVRVMPLLETALQRHPPVAAVTHASGYIQYVHTKAVWQGDSELHATTNGCGGQGCVRIREGSAIFVFTTRHAMRPARHCTMPATSSVACTPPSHLLETRRRRVHESEGVGRSIRFALAPGHLLVATPVALAHELLVRGLLILFAFGVFLLGLPYLLLVPCRGWVPVFVEGGEAGSTHAADFKVHLYTLVSKVDQ